MDDLDTLNLVLLVVRVVAGVTLALHGYQKFFMDGLNGVIFVQSIHYFPFILINLSAGLRNIDSAMVPQSLARMPASPSPFPTLDRARPRVAPR